MPADSEVKGLGSVRAVEVQLATKRELHVLNLGAGVQSTTLYLMFMRGEITPQIDCAIFEDTQEEPGFVQRLMGLPDPPGSVYAHVDWLASLGGPRIIVDTVGRLGDDLKNGRNSTGQRFAAIPAFTTKDGGATVGKTKRQCSKEYKTEPIGKVIRRQVLGLKPRQRVPKALHPIHQYIGISFDEGGRAVRIRKRFAKDQRWARPHFPLLERFMTRADCLTWLAKNYPGRHVPRSACVFCPFHNDAEWNRLKSEDPEGWARAVEVDYALRTPGSVVNRDMNQVMYLHRSCKPLDLVQLNLKPTARDLQMPMSFYQECEGVCGV